MILYDLWYILYNIIIYYKIIIFTSYYLVSGMEKGNIILSKRLPDRW